MGGSAEKLVFFGCFFSVCFPSGAAEVSDLQMAGQGRTILITKFDSCIVPTSALQFLADL